MSNKRQAGDIELYIDQLVLHGFPRTDSYRIVEAIRQELLRQIGEGGFPAGPYVENQLSYLNAGAIEARAGARPEQVGAQVAQAIYSSVTGQRRTGSEPGANRFDRRQRPATGQGTAGKSRNAEI